jgi:hypothetical protein
MVGTLDVIEAFAGGSLPFINTPSENDSSEVVVFVCRPKKPIESGSESGMFRSRKYGLQRESAGASPVQGLAQIIRF